MWAVARYDLQLSWEELSDLTPSMFRSLCERRNIRFKHQRFTAGMTAAAVYNVNRTSPDAPMLSAFDFVRDEESSRKKAERDQILSTIKKVVGSMPGDTPREKLLEVRRRTIASLKSQGRQDAEELFDSCWPTLKPKEQEE